MSAFRENRGQGPRGGKDGEIGDKQIGFELSSKREKKGATFITNNWIHIVPQEYLIRCDEDLGCNYVGIIFVPTRLRY